MLVNFDLAIPGTAYYAFKFPFATKLAEYNDLYDLSMVFIYLFIFIYIYIYNILEFYQYWSS